MSLNNISGKFPLKRAAPFSVTSTSSHQRRGVISVFEPHWLREPQQKPFAFQQTCNIEFNNKTIPSHNFDFTFILAFNSKTRITICKHNHTRSEKPYALAE